MLRELFNYFSHNWCTS